VFPGRIEIWWVKTLTGENNNSGIIDSYAGCGQPHTAHTTAKINKVEDLALILLTINTSSLSFAKYPEQAFFSAIVLIVD